MSMRGPYIGDAYIEGRGLCHVFTDLDSTLMLNVLCPDGTELYRRRSTVTNWRPKKRHEEPPSELANEPAQQLAFDLPETG